MSDFDTLKLQAYALKPNIDVEVYCYYYPEQWVESFQTINMMLGRDKKHLPFKKIKEFLYSWDSNVLYVKDIDRAFTDKQWILSRKPIDESTIIAIFKICLQITIELIQSQYTKEEFENWFKKLEDVSELKSDIQRIPLTTNDGELHENNLAFEVFPRLIYQQLENTPLVLENQNLSFITTDNGMLSEPNALFYETKKRKCNYSIRLVAQIQTIPDKRIPMLQFKFNITRWMNYKLPLKYWNDSNTSVYAHLDNRLVKLEIIKKKGELKWEPAYQEMFKAVYIGQSLPDVEQLAIKPNEIENFYVSHRFEFGNIDVGSGESMRDRHILNEWLSEVLSDYIQSLPPLLKRKSIVHQNKQDKIKENLKNAEKVQKVLASAMGQNQLNFEVYYMGEQEVLIELIKQNFEEILGIGEGELDSEHLKINISYIRQNEMLSSLDSTKKEFERHEMKIKQIQQLIPKARCVTACLVLLPFINEEGQNYYAKEEDPKKAIRAGLATTGRLSQFLDCTNPEAPEHRVKIAIYDLLRQLGYVDPFEANRFKNINYDTAISALHIINYKKTPYGNTKRAIVYIERISNQGPVMVECPALWKGKKYYWEACIAFQEVATAKGYLKFKPERVISDIKNKLYELNYKKEEPHLLLVFSDGVTRKEWPFLSDKNLSSVQKEGLYTLNSIWFEKGKENEGLKIGDDNELRIIRVRNNDEVPDYLLPRKSDGNYESKSGIFSINNVFYSIGTKPNDPTYNPARLQNYSKLLMEKANKSLKFTNLIELYPIHLNKDDNPEEWISLTHNYRNFAHQYRETLQAPLLLHMAKQLEEYIY